MDTRTNASLLRFAHAPEPLDVWHHVLSRDKGLHGRLVHDRHWFGLLLKGRGRYRIGPQAFEPRGPLAFFIPEGEDDIAALEGPVESWSVGFRWPGLRLAPSGKDLALRWPGGRVRLPRWKHVDALAATRLADLSRQLRDSLAQPGPADRLVACGHLLHWFGEYLALPPFGGVPGAHRALARFEAALRARAFEPVRLEAISAETGLTAGHLRQLFVKTHKLRPAEFRTRLRLERARELLAAGSLLVKEVAREVGFDDPLYFAKVFKKHFGVTPGELRRRASGHG